MNILPDFSVIFYPRYFWISFETPTLLEVVGTVEVPYKGFGVLPVLTVSSKCIEAHGIMAEYSPYH
jgi:hypothetical protein